MPNMEDHHPRFADAVRNKNRVILGVECSPWRGPDPSCCFVIVEIRFVLMAIVGERKSTLARDFIAKCLGSQMPSATSIFSNLVQSVCLVPRVPENLRLKQRVSLELRPLPTGTYYRRSRAYPAFLLAPALPCLAVYSRPTVRTSADRAT